MHLFRQFVLAVALGSTVANSAKGADDAKIFDDQPVWQDEADRPVKLSSWLGHGRVVMTMAYTTCQRTCPMTLKLMHDIEAKFAAKKEIATFLILSLDPQHDTPDRIKEFLSTATGHGGNWHFLRGSQQGTEKMATTLGIDAFNLDDHIVHKFKVWVFDSNGTVLHTFDWNHRDVSDL